MDYFFAIGKPNKSKYCVVKWSVFTDNLAQHGHFDYLKLI